MKLHGEFINKAGSRVEVFIKAQAPKSATQEDAIEIGVQDGEVLFTDDPIEIHTESNDTFDVLIPKSAIIRLYSKRMLGELFSLAVRSAVVNIFVDDECVFAGYLEPQTYSQPFNSKYDELELNCIDAISALQHDTYQDVRTYGTSYEEMKKGARMRSIRDLLCGILPTTEQLNISGRTPGGNYTNGGIRFDACKAIDAKEENREKLFTQLEVSELLFFGDEAKDTWTCDQVVTEILRYLNYHIIQEGFSFYLFSWDTLNTPSDKIMFYDMRGKAIEITRAKIDITNDNAADCNTEINVGEAYNRITLTCEPTNIEELVLSPFSKKQLAKWQNPKRLVREYIVKKKGGHLDRQSLATFAVLASRGDADIDDPDALYRDWYIGFKHSANWQTMNTENLLMADLITKGDLLFTLLMLTRHNVAVMMQAGFVEYKVNDRLTMPEKLDTDDYMVLTINGNDSDDPQKAMPSEAMLKKAIPYARYKSSSAADITPADEGTTNYIVISGQLTLAPVQEQSDSVSRMRHELTSVDALAEYVRKNTFKPSMIKDGRYYARTYFDPKTDNYAKTWIDASPDDGAPFDITPILGYDDELNGFVPYTQGIEHYKYNYSAKADSTDKIKKLSVLCCMLIVGDKCVVERSHTGTIADYIWVDYKTRDKCASDEEYYAQSFTIGVDPKIGDPIIGKPYDIQNNIDFKMGIDAKGTAIPIRHSDNIRGNVEFMILGPYNLVWNDITKRAPSFWRHTKWKSKDVLLLSHVSNIFIKKFDIKVMSSSGILGDEDTQDIIYSSITDDRFVNEKETITMKVHSALTTEERNKLGIKGDVWLSVPHNKERKAGVVSLYDTYAKAEAKPEQLYISSYYNECSKPRVQITQNLCDKSDTRGRYQFCDIFKHPAIGRIMYVTAMDRNIMQAETTLKLKESW